MFEYINIGLKQGLDQERSVASKAKIITSEHMTTPQMQAIATPQR